MTVSWRRSIRNRVSRLYSFTFCFLGEIPYELDEETKPQKSTRAMSTTIIFVCLVTVSIVMIAVFIGLCVARRRAIRMSGSISGTDSTSRSNAYMASVQAAQMNAIYGGGTMQRVR